MIQYGEIHNKIYSIDNEGERQKRRENRREKKRKKKRRVFMLRTRAIDKNTLHLNILITPVKSCNILLLSNDILPYLITLPYTCAIQPIAYQLVLL